MMRACLERALVPSVGTLVHRLHVPASGVALLEHGKAGIHQWITVQRHLDHIKSRECAAASLADASVMGLGRPGTRGVAVAGQAHPAPPSPDAHDHGFTGMHTHGSPLPHPAAAVHHDEFWHDQGSEGAAAAAAVTHDHDHDHRHGHSHGHSHATPSLLSRTLEYLEEGTLPTLGKLGLLAAYALVPFADVPVQLAGALQAGALAGTYALACPPAAASLVRQAMSRKADTHLLMGLAALGTVLAGHAAEGALLLALFQTSHALEHKLTRRARGDLASLFADLPRVAAGVEVDPRDGSPRMATLRRRDVSAFVPGEHLLVTPGERCPLDGVIVHGSAAVSTEHLTGESVPARRGPSDALPAGALVHDGALVMRVLHPAAASTPARLAALALDAQAARPALRRTLDRFTDGYARGVLLAAATAAVGLCLVGVAPADSAYRAMALLTVASPCALALAPLGYVAGVAVLARRGVLLASGGVLDAVAKCSQIALDKTGTLTAGEPRVASYTCIPAGFDDAAPGPTSAAAAETTPANAVTDPLARAGLALGAALGARSAHPLSAPTVAYAADAGGLNAGTVQLDDFFLEPGYGVQARASCDGGDAAGVPTLRGVARFGSLNWVAPMVHAGAQRHALETAARAAQARGRAVAALALAPDRRGVPNAAGDAVGSSAPSQTSFPVWLFEYEDRLRPSSAAVVARLEALPQLRHGVVMLTGDSQGAALAAAQALGLPRAATHAGLSPAGKLQAVRDAQARGAAVLMAGDGLNDAAALSAADVGVATGPTLEGLAADVALVGDSGVKALPALFDVARDVRAVTTQNLVIALGAVALLAGPVLAGAVPLWAAVTAHEGSTLLVALNSLRVLHRGRER